MWLRTAAILLASAAALSAQLPPSEHVTGIANLALVVGDLERARTFYRDTLGLQVEGNVAGVPGGPLSLELTRSDAADRKPVTRGLQDPGAVRVLLTVRDLDAAMLQLRFSGATVMSDGDGPIALVDEPGVTRAVLIRDPDGFFVQLMQHEGAVPVSAPAGNVTRLSVGLTVDDMGRTTRMFRDVLGFDLRRDPEDNDDSRLAMMGVFTAFYRRVIATVPGTAFELELIEIHGLARRLITARVQDPGTAMLGLRVTDVGRTIDSLRGNEIVTLTAEGASTIARTPDRFLLRLAQ